MWPGSPVRADTSCGAIVDEKSGEKASVLVLYGLAITVLPTPRRCAIRPPATSSSRARSTASIKVPGVKEPVHYRWAIYTKRVGGVNRYEEAYYTFLHDGDWLPDVGGSLEDCSAITPASSRSRSPIRSPA